MSTVWDKNDPDAEPLVLNEKLDNAVILDGLPRVKKSKFEKLLKLIRNKFGGHGKIMEDGIYMPIGDDDKTLGYCFIEYEHPDSAASAIAKEDNKPLDNKHTFLVNSITDYEKFMSVKEEYEPAKKSEYESQVNLTSWLLDGRDQFILRYQHDTKVYWNDPFRLSQTLGRELKYGGERQKNKDQTWTEFYTHWSNTGSYLATFHRQGIAVWAGDNFTKLGRFKHTGVKVVDFSPCDRYLVTCNGEEAVKRGDDECIIIWDVKTGKKLRGFDGGLVKTWPSFGWSRDGKYFSRIGKDRISVYSTPGMGLIEKKSIPLKNVQEVQWSPKDNVLSYWVPEVGNLPARIGLIGVPSKKSLSDKHLYSVSDVKMHWQDEGDYLSVKLKRKKTKKTFSTNFEIFRMRNKNIPIEVLDITDTIVAFAWEPKGARFAIIHGPGPNPARPNVSFYVLQKKKFQLLGTIESRPANCLFWSPVGGTLVIAGLGPLNGALEFFNVDTMESMCQTEHFNCVDVNWDPSGRYVITAVTQPLGEGAWKYKMDNGYIVHSFQGDQLNTVPLESLYQVMWRPRPDTLLSKQQLKSLKDNLKAKYWSQFEKEDDEIRRSQFTGAEKLRQEMKEFWRKFRAEKDAMYREQSEERISLRHGARSDDEDDWETREQEFEVVLDVKEEAFEK